MSYDKNATPKYSCIVNITRSFVANSIASAKRQASDIVNESKYIYSVDAMNIYTFDYGILVTTLKRANHVKPDKTIIRGKWN